MMRFTQPLGLVIVCALLQACANVPSDPIRDKDGAVNLEAQALPVCDESAKSEAHAPCVFAPNEAKDGQERNEHSFRKSAGEPDWRQDDSIIGVALSGGGSRASANAMGVLAGLDDLGLLTHIRPGKTQRRVGLISSVSGGGYAAYYLYSHLLHPFALPVERHELFHDCVTFFNTKGDASEDEKNGTFATTELVEAVKPYMCTPDTYAMEPETSRNAWEGDGLKLQARHQAAIRCQQDVLQPGKCSSKFTSQDGWATGSSIVALTAHSLMTALPHHFANSLFDFGINISPSRAVYVNGIDLTYGGVISQDFRPTFKDGTVRGVQITCPKSNADTQSTQGHYSLHECDEQVPYPKPRRWTLSEFSNSWAVKHAEQLARESEQTEPNTAVVLNYPYWIIQATSAPTRGLAGWLNQSANRKDVWNNSFEFTAKHFGSRRYGFVSGAPADMQVIDAVVSAAAFLDANQQYYDGFGWRPSIGAFLHAANANWGIDLPNYNTSPLRRSIHRITPFPLNNLDAAWTSLTEEGPKKDRMISSFIRLTDGGNTENLAAIAMIRRGVKNIVISDAAADDKGTFGDLCHLKRALNPMDAEGRASLPDGQALFMYIPGLEGFDKACAEGGEDALLSYSMNAWTHAMPLLLGCVQSNEAINPQAPCSAQDEVVSRLFIYKPAVTEKALQSAKRTQIKECKVIDYSRPGMPTAILLQEAARTVCTGSVNAQAKGTSLAPSAACQAALPCEAARLINSGSKGFPTGEGAFITTTVAVTANSSGTLYASYRELARHAIHAAKDLLVNQCAENFQRELSFQTMSPVPSQSID